MKKNHASDTNRKSALNQSDKRYRLVHLSDLHFMVSPRWFDYCSLRLPGALNLVLNRRQHYPLARAIRLVERVLELEPDYVVISGDITQLSLPGEFKIAQRTLKPLLELGAERVTIVPGNHDRYVWMRNDAFTEYFGEYFGTEPIKTTQLTEHWHLAGWDSAVVSPPFYAYGRVNQQTLLCTERWLKELPSSSKSIVVNHYPLRYPNNHKPAAHHALKDYARLGQWVEDHGVDLYLHGHEHRNWVIQSSTTHVNSASSSRLPRVGEKSSFHLIELCGTEFSIQPIAF